MFAVLTGFLCTTDEVLILFAVIKQAQLSLRDRTMLRVIEHFAALLKVIGNDTIHCVVCKSLLVFYNYVCISYRF